MYPPLLERYLAVVLQLSILRPAQLSLTDAAPNSTEAAEAKLNRARFSFKEQISWLEPLRGTIQPTDKEAADNLAIGGLRNTAASVGRLHMVAAFGRKIGAALRTLLTTNSASSTPGES